MDKTSVTTNLIENRVKTAIKVISKTKSYQIALSSEKKNCNYLQLPFLENHNMPMCITSVKQFLYLQHLKEHDDKHTSS